MLIIDDYYDCVRLMHGVQSVSATGSMIHRASNAQLGMTTGPQLLSTSSLHNPSADRRESHFFFLLDFYLCAN